MSTSVSGAARPPIVASSAPGIQRTGAEAPRPARRWPEEPWEPGLDTGTRVQAVCEAMERAADERRWVAVSEVQG
jgi:hypothetical protein